LEGGGRHPGFQNGKLGGIKNGRTSRQSSRWPQGGQGKRLASCSREGRKDQLRGTELGGGTSIENAGKPGFQSAGSRAQLGRVRSRERELRAGNLAPFRDGKKPNV